MWRALMLVAALQGGDFDAAGYRIARYRGVVAAAPAGVVRIDADAARALQRRGARLIDVTPADGGHWDAARREWRLAEAHATIHGARWLPEAGRGDAPPGVIAWLLRAAPMNKRAPVVVFCLADCWMSWNAARRLVAAGHRDVRWFAEGIDGWRERGWPLVPAAPAGGLECPAMIPKA